MKSTGGKDAVAQIGLGRGAQSGDGAGAAKAVGLAAVMWVAWMAVQRSDSSNSAISISTGRRPEKARQSSTSFTCSATWTWMGASGGRPAITSRSSSGVTARSECGEMPTRRNGWPFDSVYSRS